MQKPPEKIDPPETPPVSDPTTDEAATCELALPALLLNMVVLENVSSPPVVAYSSTIDCTASNEWPCLHPAALTEYFEGDEELCLDPADEATCVRFEYGAHKDYDPLWSAHTDPNCQVAIDLADSATTGTTTYADFDSWGEALRLAILGCLDTEIFNPEMGNIYIVDNPFNTNSFNGADATETCLPVNFIDVTRLAADPAVSVQYEQAAAEHEMGHAYGLSHACSDPFAPTDQDPSNIMETGPDCCCESWARQEAEEAGSQLPLAWFSTFCTDCSEDTAAPPACDNSPTLWNDTGCDGSWMSQGDRSEPFTDLEYSTWFDGAPGQVERIVEIAEERCRCLAGVQTLRVNYRPTVKGELLCHGGTATVGLFPLYRIDPDEDGDAFFELVPMVISGDHLGRTAWITSINVVDFGEVTALHLPTQGNGFAFHASDPEDLLTTGLVNLTPGAPSATLSQGVTGTGYLWGAEGVSTSGNFDWPEVELTFACSGAGGTADIYSHARPPAPYRLLTRDIAGSWNQQILVRTDFTNMKVWFEPRGYPRIAEVMPLTASSGGWYDWSLNAFGFVGSGKLKPAGTPMGSKLSFTVTSASYNGWSTSNVTLPDLVRLP